VGETIEHKLISLFYWLQKYGQKTAKKANAQNILCILLFVLFLCVPLLGEIKKLLQI
jgi:hypothetical protein